MITTICRILLIVFTCVPILGHAQTYKETFPRIGAYEIASARKVAQPEFRERLAKHDIVVLGMWRNWSTTDEQTGQRLTLRDIVVDLKQRSAAEGKDILVGKYAIYNESYSNRNNSATRDRWDKLSNETGPGYPTNNDWWARDKDGAVTSSYNGTWSTNVTDFVTRDSDGFTWTEWAATRDYNEFFRNTPEFDFLFVDNWFHKPRVTADWDGDGTNDGKGADWVKRAYRNGHMDAVRRFRELDSSLFVMGNVDGHPVENVGMLQDEEYRGKVAGLVESVMGRSWSHEVKHGWGAMMDQYQTTLANARDGIVIITVDGDTADNYQFMRYGLTSCLMDDGYYYYTTKADHYKSALWYDEYDADLGKAIDPPQFSPWRNGIYRRRFENGMALVNPRGNGTKTVQIEPGYRRISGTQDPATNNGQPVDSVTLNERDGLVLVKESVAKKVVRPMPPVLLQ